MDKFSTLASSKICNFLLGSKRFVHKDYSSFKYIHGSMFMGQLKDKVFVFKMSLDLTRIGVDLVKRIYVGKYMKN